MTDPNSSTNYDTDVHRSVRYSAEAERQIEAIVQEANARGYRVRGRRNTVFVKPSHVIRMAIEAGLPSVLASLEAMQDTDGGEA